MYNSNKGISLVIMMIAIIVIIVLSGVIIAIVVGENGIIKKTTEAQLKSEIEQYKEELKISILNDEMVKKRK